MDGFLQPTSASALHSDMKSCVVGYTAAVVAQFDIERGKLLQLLSADCVSSDHGTGDARVNQAS